MVNLPYRDVRRAVILIITLFPGAHPDNVRTNLYYIYNVVEKTGDRKTRSSEDRAITSIVKYPTITLYTAFNIIHYNVSPYHHCLTPSSFFQYSQM